MESNACKIDYKFIGGGANSKYLALGATALTPG